MPRSKEQQREYNKRNHQRHRAARLAAMKRYREANKAKVHARQKQWRSENADRVASVRLAWYQNHRVYSARRQREYREKNKEALKLCRDLKIGIAEARAILRKRRVEETKLRRQRLGMNWHY